MGVQPSAWPVIAVSCLVALRTGHALLNGLKQSKEAYARKHA